MKDYKKEDIVYVKFETNEVGVPILSEACRYGYSAVINYRVENGHGL